MVKRLGSRWIPAFDDGVRARRSAGLAGFAATLLIIVLALVIVRKLQVRCILEECVMSGEPGCQHAADRLRVSRAMEGLLDDARWLVEGWERGGQ